MNGIRIVIWGLISALMKLMDIAYKIVIEVASINFISDTNVWKWYYALMAFLALFIMLRVTAMFFKFSFDEEFRDKFSISNFMNKIVLLALLISLFPPILKYSANVMVWAMNNTSIILGSNTKQVPSTIVLSAFMATETIEYDENGNVIKGEKVEYTIEDIDINEDGTGDEDYKYFNDLGTLFTLLIIGVASSFLLILNALQVGKRSYSLVMKVIIAPIPISSLVVPSDESFTMWRKMIVSDFVLNFVQTLMIMIVIILSGSKTLQSSSVWVQIISLIAGLLLVLSGIPELSKILGGDSSTGGILKQLAIFRVATHKMGSGLKKGAKALGGGAKTAAAYGAYGMGRFMGGSSIKQMKDTNKDGSESGGGFMGGSEAGDSAGETSFNSTKENNSNSDAQTRYTREGTIANQFANWQGKTEKGYNIKANLVKNSAKHVYKNSMGRVERSKPFRTSLNVKKLGGIK